MLNFWEMTHFPTSFFYRYFDKGISLLQGINIGFPFKLFSHYKFDAVSEPSVAQTEQLTICGFGAPGKRSHHYLFYESLFQVKFIPMV